MQGLRDNIVKADGARRVRRLWGFGVLACCIAGCHRTSRPPALDTAAFPELKSIAMSPVAIPAGWKQYTSKEGGYKILMPGKPTAVVRNKNQDSFKTVRLQTKAALYSVSFRGGPIFTGSAIPELFGWTQRTTIRGLHARLMEEQSISVGGYPGKEFLIITPEAKYQRNRMIIVKNRYYVITMSGTRRALISEDGDTFFNSFQLLDPGQK